MDEVSGFSNNIVCPYITLLDVVVYSRGLYLSYEVFVASTYIKGLKEPLKALFNTFTDTFAKLVNALTDGPGSI